MHSVEALFLEYVTSYDMARDIDLDVGWKYVFHRYYHMLMLHMVDENVLRNEQWIRQRL